MKIELKNNNGFKWYSSKNIWVKGYFFDTDNKLYENDSLLSYFSTIKNSDDFEEKLKNTNGMFCVIIENSTNLFFAVDRNRTMPLFYDTDGITITDSTEKFNFNSDNFDKKGIDEYLNCAYITGTDTLVPNIKQCQAGEFCNIDKNQHKIKTKRYFEFEHKDFYTFNDEKLINILDKSYLEVFKRTINLLDGRTAVVPLSGGYDSRLIVEMLSRLKCKNVICFSYGKKGNWESEISKKVANYFGYKWIFIEYTKKELYDLYQKEVKKYTLFSTNISSFAHTQDLLAVKKIYENNLIPNDSVFIPGHSGDMVAGSHIPKNIFEKKEYNQSDIVNILYRKHYGLQKVKKDFKNNLENSLKEKIISIIKNKEVYSQEEAANELERWNWQERQSKYICNSVKVYEFYKYSWLMPLWDKEFMDFWSKVDVKRRVNRKLYFEYVKATHICDVPINPKEDKSFVSKIINRLDDIWYARFNGDKNIFKKYNIKLDNLFKNINISYINKNINIYKYPKVGINILNMYFIIKKNHK